ncbi:hypothetical protein CTheo_1510 [Ceratobasidium theobromae]|uniref:Uncharacterized protein n=1 Tax=Ceratobasidium theobromae TaxID=1582974 RepID=A0A5N5QTU2_9AGAM|nr:hypothetical protein CTheo_1510 [Ceratobasidium theobromae]
MGLAGGACSGVATHGRHVIINISNHTLKISHEIFKKIEWIPSLSCGPQSAPELFQVCRIRQRLSNEDASGSGEDGSFKRSKRVKVDPQTVSSWFRDEGLPYLHPTPGKTNWLGGLKEPFPDNPTFQPPPPLSDAIKSSIYDRYLQSFQRSAFKSDSHKKAVRSLSEQFGISIARVEAIIRLKEYQRQYEKVGYASY